MAFSTRGPGLPTRDGFHLYAGPLKEGPKEIEDGMIQVLLTRKGEFPMQPEKGSRLHELPFDQQGFAFEYLIEQHVRDALAEQEPRVDVTAVAVVRPEPNQTVVRIEYRVRRTNQPGVLSLFVGDR